jgi:hypothetical protein
MLWSEFLNNLGYAPNSLPATFYDTNLQTDSSYEPGGVGAEKLYAHSEMAVGAGNAIAVMSGTDPGYRIWVGNPDPALAAFSVDKNGVLRATGAIISGEIDIPDTTSTNSFHVDTNGNMWLGANASSFSSAPFRVSNAGDLVANSGTFDSGNVIIGTFANGISFKNLAATAFLNAANNSVAAVVYVNSSNELVIDNVQTSGASKIILSAATLDTGNIDLGSDNIINASQIEFFDAKLVSGKTRYAFKDPSSNEQFSITPAGGGNTKISMNGFDLRLTSSKTAIVPTSEGFNALYSAESPEVWFFDFCDGSERIDPLFLEVTEGEMKFIPCTDGTFQVWRRRKYHAHKRFTPKTAEEFDKNEKFLRQAKV